jgi:hypothetical protein
MPKLTSLTAVLTAIDLRSCRIDAGAAAGKLALSERGVVRDFTSEKDMKGEWKGE